MGLRNYKTTSSNSKWEKGAFLFSFHTPWMKKELLVFLFFVVVFLSPGDPPEKSRVFALRSPKPRTHTQKSSTNPWNDLCAYFRLNLFYLPKCRYIQTTNSSSPVTKSQMSSIKLLITFIVCNHYNKQFRKI